ncbi:MAG: YceI family protein [Thiolinea sp.]
MNFKQVVAPLFLAGGLLASPLLIADDYAFDVENKHSFVQFRVQHLGYSWLYGRFNEFDGNFSFDEASPDKAAVNVTIKTASVDSNHAERDKHLRSEDFLDVDKFPEATFKSTAYKPAENGKGVIEGELTLRGVTKPVSIEVEQIGTGEDPWGGYRRGFEGRAQFKMADFGITKDLGPASQVVEMILSVEGIKQ